MLSGVMKKQFIPPYKSSRGCKPPEGFDKW